MNFDEFCVTYNTEYGRYVFFKLEFKPGVGGGFLRAFTSQKGPGKGLLASGFAPERR